VRGTPGEDCGRGTHINIVSLGTFCRIDSWLMVAWLKMNLLYLKFYTLLVAKDFSKDKASHASALPWEQQHGQDVMCITES